MIYEEIRDLFKTILKLIPPKKTDYYQTKYQRTIKWVNYKWYSDNINASLPPIKIGD